MGEERGNSRGMEREGESEGMDGDMRELEMNDDEEEEGGEREE